MIRTDNFINAEIFLYDIDQDLDEGHFDYNLKKMINLEPKKPEHFSFLLPSSFESENLMGFETICKPMTVKFDKEWHLKGSIIYENIEQNLLNLIFFTTKKR